MNAEHRQLVARLAFSFVPPLYRQWSVIAGGFAADPEQTNDVDLYMLGNPNAKRVISWLQEQRIEHCDSRNSYGNERLIANIGVPFGAIRKIQLLGAKQTTVEELLDSFDITTHMWALKEDGTIIRGTKATGTDEPGKIVRFDTLEDTVRRAEKIGRRYCIEVE